MEDMKISKTQNEKFDVLANEKRSIRAVLDLAMESATNRIFEVNRLNDALWKEIMEQFDLDMKTKKWVIGNDRIIKEKVTSRRFESRRGFMDTMEDTEDDEKDTSS